jgi:signal transduction histidine kinase
MTVKGTAMRLFYKVYFFLIVILIVVLGWSGYIDYKRELSHFNNDMKSDALLIGKAMSGPIEHVWKQSGMDTALSLIREANRDEHQMGIRWVWLDSGPGEPYIPRAPLKLLNKVLEGESVSLAMDDSTAEAFRFTYIPVKVDQDRPGALEISESLGVMKKYTHDSLLHLFYTGGLLLLAFGGILWHRFQSWIHQPLKRFIEKSVKIGEGDLAPDLAVKGHDEFSLLAATLNAMCENLDASLKAIRVEHEKRISALEQLRHAERLATLGRLSSGVAHELGTPLNIISGRSKMIRAGDLKQMEMVDNARIIGEQADRMTQIIRSLLDFARRGHPNRQLEDMGFVAGKVVEMLTSTAGKAKVSLELSEEGELPRIFIDSAQIQQVLTNLIMNGIQAMPDGGRLSLTLSEVNTRHPDSRSGDRKYVAVRVEDEGQGIAEDDMDHLFEPFFTTKDVGQGSGLGLSIAFGIVEEHAGWIHVENLPDRGACFTVFLPVENG